MAALALLGGFAVAAVSGKCLDLGLFSFGCTSEHIIESSDSLKQEVKDTIEQYSEANLGTEVLGETVLDVEYGDWFTNLGEFEVSQTIHGDITVINKVDEFLSADVEMALKARFDERMKDEKVRTGIISLLAKTPTGTSITKFITDVHTAIETSTQEQVLIDIYNRTHAKNSIKLKFGDHVTVGNTYYGQEIVLQVFIDNTVSVVMQAVHKLAVITEIEKVFEHVEEVDTSGTEKTFVVVGLVLLFVFLLIKTRKPSSR